jgi:hypothetical protein
MLKGILSERKFNSWPSWHVIYEYEDIMSDYFNSPIFQINGSLIKKIINKTKCKNEMPYKKIKNDYNIAICLSPHDGNNFKKYNVIPIFLDVYEKDIATVLSTTKNLPLFFVTNYAIYDKIKAIEENANVYCVPLSVSDKWKYRMDTKRDIDVIQIGRKNKKLHEYMMQYCQEHTSVNYVFQNAIGKDLRYVSTIDGDIGNCMSREEYFSLLYRSKISLVSSPGVDNERKFGEGIDFITPRFYESAAAGCYMVGRYTKNYESEEICLSTVCDNVSSYEEFAALISKYLQSEQFLKAEAFRSFLNLNYTSVRMRAIENVLERSNLL